MNVTNLFRNKPAVPRHLDVDAPLDAAWTMHRPKPQPDPFSPEYIEKLIAECRDHGVQLATELRRAGRPGRALYEIARSVERQARIAGIGTWHVNPESLRHDSAWSEPLR